jgi:hypothetical protein
MKLSILYEERWLPPDVEKFAQEIWQKIIDNPGKEFQDEFTGAVEDREFVIRIAIIYDIGDQSGVSGSTQMYAWDKRMIRVFIKRGTSEEHTPFDRMQDEKIYRVLFHELTHVMDPKTTEAALRKKKWGMDNPDVMQKGEEASQKIMRGQGGEEYWVRPWEMDAEFNSVAASRYRLYRRNKYTPEQMLGKIKIAKPYTQSEWAFKKHGHWNKFLSYLYRYIKHKTESVDHPDDAPRSQVHARTTNMPAGSARAAAVARARRALEPFGLDLPEECPSGGMKLSILYEERWLPPDVEKFAEEIYKHMIDNPGEEFQNTFEKYEGYRKFTILIEVAYENAERGATDGQSWADSWEMRHVLILITRPPDERNEPFPEGYKENIYRVLIHELTHVMDPKVLESKLRDKRWGINDPKIQQKRHRSFTALRAGLDGGDDYFMLPWEVDAEFNATAAIRYRAYKQNELTTEEMLGKLKVAEPSTRVEEVFKERGLWNKYLSYLYRYIKHKAEQEAQI